MADTSGVAALLKALNDTPGLGAGLKPSAAAKTGATKASDFAAAAGVASPNNASTPATAARPIRAASSMAARSTPKSFIADGKAYDTKAPRGTYVNIII